VITSGGVNTPDPVIAGCTMVLLLKNSGQITENVHPSQGRRHATENRRRHHIK
jgi:hypothetical protein